MNSAQWTVPDTVSATPADAICSIGFGSDLVTGSGNEANTFGCGVLISATQILTAAHIMPNQASGTYSVPTDSTKGARVVRFRRKTDGTCPATGLCTGYYQRNVVSYTIPNPAKDIAICTLDRAVGHITPIAIDTGTPAVSDAIEMGGWGLDGATLFSGSRPNDCRTILATKTISAISNDANGFNAYITISATNPGPNLYDSGAPIFRTINAAWAVCGIIVASDVAINLIQFAHDSSFQIPGLYTPGSGSTQNTSSTWVDPSFDTTILQSDPAANNSALTYVTAKYATGKGADDGRVILVFDLRSITAPITGAALTLFSTQTYATGTARTNRIRRTGVSALANWNTYDGTNNWTTAGASDTTNDIYSANQFDTVVPEATVSGPVYFTDASLLAMVQAAKADDGYLRIVIRLTTETQMIWYSIDALNTSIQPRLELTTTADTSKRVRSDSDGTRSYMRSR